MLANAGMGLRAAAANTANLTVNAGKTLRVVDNRIFGLNTGVYEPYADTYGYQQALVQLVAAPTGALRYPGGSVADEFNWQDTTIVNPLYPGSSVPGSTTTSFASWGMDFDQFAQFAELLNAQVFITANYGTGTPAEAAAWVRYSNVTQKYGFKYWEIGNECFGFWEMDGNTPAHDPVEYATRFAQYFVAMKAVDPTIKVGAVVSPGEDDYPSPSDPAAVNPRTKVAHYGCTPEVLSTLAKLGVTPDFLIFHNYVQDPGDESDANLLQLASNGGMSGQSPVLSWSGYAAELRQQLTDYLGSAGAGVELDCTESNSVSTNPGKQTVSLVNGLFMADSVGSILQSEFKTLLWFDTFDGKETGGNISPSLYGWRLFGDYGVMAATGNPYPTFYVHKLLGFFARGGDSVIQASSDNLLLSVYAVRRLDGSVALLVVNKDPAHEWVGNISLAGFLPQPVATAYSYGIPQDAASQVNPETAATDVQVSSLGGISAGFAATFAPYSATVLALTELPPVLTGSPASVSVENGSTIVLTASATGAASYQWMLNGKTVLADSPAGSTDNVILGATGPQLVISHATSLSDGSYTVVAINPSGQSKPSQPATVSVAANPSPGHLAGTFARAGVGTGDAILTRGFSIAGTTSRTVLVQALGPALAAAPYNVTNPVQHPTLSIHQNQNGKDVLLYSDTGWGSSPVLRAAATAAHAAPPMEPGSADSGLLLTLPPGAYSAEVSGADGGTGVAVCAITPLP
jgi:hypothetical protein